MKDAIGEMSERTGVKMNDEYYRRVKPKLL